MIRANLFGLCAVLLCAILLPVSFAPCAEEVPGPDELGKLETSFRAIKTLLDQSRPSDERVKASLILSGVASAEYIPLLDGLLDDQDPKVREAVIYTYALCAAADSERFPVRLLDLLCDEDSDVRCAVTNVDALFSEFPPEAQDAFAKCLNDDAWQVRGNVAGIMYRLDGKSRESLPLLKKLLNDKHQHVAHNAANSIWRMTRDAQLVVPSLVRRTVEFAPKSRDDVKVEWIASVYLIRNIGIENPEACLSALVGMFRNEMPVDLTVQVIRSIGAVSAETAASRQAARKLQIRSLLKTYSVVENERVALAAFIALDRIRNPTKPKTESP